MGKAARHGSSRRWSSGPLGARPGVATGLEFATRDEMIDVLRDALAASTPSPHGGYRESPPSSCASSCGGQVELDDIISHEEEDDDDSERTSSIEWEAWIDWQAPLVQRAPRSLQPAPALEAMRLSD
jgi:hypothetical protein